MRTLDVGAGVGLFLAFVVGGLVMAGCGAGASDDVGRTELVVGAASSLTDAFGAIEVAFEATFPDVDVVLDLAGSATLREQVLAGAPLDVLVTADTATMQVLAEAGEVRPSRVVATNRLVVAVANDNPLALTGLEDFARPELLLGLCAPDVPCGSLAQDALERAGVTPDPDTLESNVRALASKVAQGQLDAAVTYVTDVAWLDGAVEALAIPPEIVERTSYPIAVLEDTPHRDQAATFVQFVMSPTGQELLAAHGFGPP